MICPVCGCQQREASKCIQCYTTLVPEEDTGGEFEVSLENRSVIPPPEDVPLEESLPRPVEKKVSPPPEPPVEQPVEKKASRPVEPSFVEVKSRKKVLKAKAAPKVEAVVGEKKTPSPEALPPKPIGEKPPRRIAASKTVIRKEKKHPILVTTTQRIEGKRITSYFGLISADIIIELGEASSHSDQSGKSVNAHYRGELKKGMLTVLRDLRGEAALLGANAVIATSFNFQKMDLQALLVSAVGTAVHMEDRI
ncbi:MAG: heavy metal-binding domain-containing protein [Nitrospiria bacterium]